MPAIIETGGKQYLVSKGEKIQVEKLPGKTGDTVKFDQVLLLDTTVGKPRIAGAVVEGKILKQARSKKVSIFKYKAKSRYRRRQGHRQFFTEVEITKATQNKQ